MKIRIILILTILISSCGGTKNLTELSELTIQNQTANKFIVDRKPDYGDGNRDGCVIMDEISMDIDHLNERSISGKVFDSKTKEPLNNAKLTLITNQNGLTNKTIITSNFNGFFKSELNGKPTKIEVEYIAYRNLKINLEKQ